MTFSKEREYIYGSRIYLRPMMAEEFSQFYKWATKSDATPYWFGDQPPSYFAFKHDWPAYYFDGSKPFLGRCFTIVADERPIGQINYNEIDPLTKSVQLDILIAKQKNMNKGYGSEAINLFVSYLFREMDLIYCWVDILADNVRAHKAFEKANFKRTKQFIRSEKTWCRYCKFHPSFHLNPTVNID